MSPLPRQGWLFLIEFLKWYFSKYWQVRTRPVFAQTVTYVYGTGDYEVVHSCGSSEVMHLACVHVHFIRYILYFQMHSTLQGIVSSALVRSCGNSEVTTFIMCAHYYQVYFQILDTYNCIGSTHLHVQSCRNGGQV